MNVSMSMLLLLLLLVTTTTNQLCYGFNGIRSLTTGTTSPVLLRTTSTTKTTKSTTTTATSAAASTTKLYSFFDNFFKKAQGSEPVVAIQPKFDPVTIEPDYRIAGVFLVLGILLDTIPYIQLTIGPFITLLGILFLVQTVRLRFVFDENNNLELQSLFNTKDQSTGENIIVGGANKWDCNTIVNYDFFPKGWIDTSFTGPILVYFKETQTPESTWNDGPGKSANDPIKIANGQAIPGQVHFFPAICNAKQIRDEFNKRGCCKL